MIMRDLAISQLAALVEAVALGGQGSAITCRAEAAARAARLTEVLELYVERVALRDLVNKSADQRRAWRQVLDRAVKNFLHVADGRQIGAIGREDAMMFYVWWGQRLKPKFGGRALTSASANREFGALRKLYREYFEYFGEIDDVNPFKGLSFKRMPSAKAPPFDDRWVRDRILEPVALGHMRQEARRLIYVLIETGAKTSEIANLTTDDIILSADAPFIKIRPRKDREPKTHSSIREIPLVGVALEAMRR
jgi:site-specific recombinase XerD